VALASSPSPPDREPLREVAEKLRREAKASYELAQRHAGDLELVTQYKATGRMAHEAARMIEAALGPPPRGDES
jgi:hypothetical protein